VFGHAESSGKNEIENDLTKKKARPRCKIEPFEIHEGGGLEARNAFSGLRRPSPFAGDWNVSRVPKVC
jgi:hypothetical protein